MTSTTTHDCPTCHMIDAGYIPITDDNGRCPMTPPCGTGTTPPTAGPFVSASDVDRGYDILEELARGDR